MGNDMITKPDGQYFSDMSDPPSRWVWVIVGVLNKKKMKIEYIGRVEYLVNGAWEHCDAKHPARLAMYAKYGGGGPSGSA